LWLAAGAVLPVTCHLSSPSAAARSIEELTAWAVRPKAVAARSDRSVRPCQGPWRCVREGRNVARRMRSPARRVGDRSSAAVGEDGDL